MASGFSRMPAPRRLKFASVVLLVMAGCAQPPSVATVGFAPLPAAQARIWVYRDLEVYDSVGTPSVRLNDQVAGLAEKGGAFYRDVPPGHYHITVDSMGTDVYQSSDVDLATGQEAYVKIEALQDWFSSTGKKSGVDRPTFYARLVPNDFGRFEVWSKAFYGNGQVAALPRQ